MKQPLCGYAKHLRLPVNTLFYSPLKTAEMKKKLLLHLLLLCAHISFAQELYMPLEFRMAYESGTRKWDGTVSDRYRQNRSSYKLQATIDPHKRILNGSASITYFNNFPDTLNYVVFHTYHDYYKPTSRKAGFFSRGPEMPSNHEGVVLDELVVDGVRYTYGEGDDLRYGGTHYVVRLQKPLLPAGSVKLSVKWHYQIPYRDFERSGAIDSTSMFIAYWYPEIAVFDDIEGWDRIVYDAATEFYHDYSDYEVEITLPDNFIVWASVPPSNPEEVYTPAVQARLEKARQQSDVVRIVDESDFRTQPSGSKTWRYVAKNFPDFSFALSDHFLWEARSYADAFGQYFLQVAYPPKHPEFGAVLSAMERSLHIFHNQFPLYPFPYRYFTIFNGLVGGGMEFPGMANNQQISGAMLAQFTGKEIDDAEAQLGLTLHEMCHMYFPFMMGIHEKKYAWMDEGWASFSEYFIDNFFAENDWDKPFLASQRVLPMMTPTYLAEGTGLNSYTLAAQSYIALYELLGRDLFLRCLHQYMDTWKHKHPTPYDFMFTFNRVSGQNLNWFWKKWYFDWGYMDLGIASVKGNAVAVKNYGGRPVYFKIVVTYDDGTRYTKSVSPAVWKNTDTFVLKIPVRKKKIKQLRLEIPVSGDAVAANNTWSAG
jgi:hypothetical protein